ncbi:MAG: histidine kinase [Treponema sp.]|nr:histidine kinase [Treponema sp.]
MSFSKRIVLVYASIIIIPILILVMAVSSYNLHKQVQELEKVAVSEIQNDTENIYRILDEINSIETVVTTDDRLNLFLYNPDNYTEDETIDVLIEKTNLFEQIQSITPNIYSIRIFTNNEKIPERWPVILQSWRLNPIPNEWNLNYKADFLGNLDPLKSESVCLTRELQKNRRQIGYFQTSVKVQDFFPSIYSNVDPHNSQFIFRKDINDEYLCLVLENILDEKLPQLVTENNKRIQKRIINSNQNIGSIIIRPFYKMVSWSFIPEMNIYLVTENTNPGIIHGFSVYIFSIIAAVIFMTIALYLIVKYTTNRLMSGIYSVMDGMKKVKEGDVSVTIPISGLDEVAETQQIFNSMTQQLSSQIEQIKTEQSLIADTEMKAMQNQINAHFLYNVLETIRMQAVLADQDDISESLQVLGKMMRYCLRWRIHRVSLSQEIEYIRSYVYILNIRNDYTISLEVDIPEEYMDIEIPKMTLQPLIENAFVHAIEKTENDALLKVFAEVSEDRIVLSVQDFGEGMSEDQLKRIKDYLADSTYERDSKGSIGLKNIQQRLTVFYGEEYKVQINSKLGEGTTISVPVPLKRIAQ